MSDVDKVIEAIEEMPLTASVNDLLTYLPKIFEDDDVPTSSNKRMKHDGEGQDEVESPDQATDD